MAEPSPRQGNAPVEVETAPSVPAEAAPADLGPSAPGATTVVTPAPAPEPPATPAPAPEPPATPAPATPPPSSSEAPAAVILVEPEARAHADRARRWSVDAAFGVWGKPRSDGSGRDWQLAYGLRFGRALLPSLELEIELLRSGGSAGNPFVSASSTHNLAALRAFWVLGSDYALLLGGGGGVAVSQTHYLLQPTTDPRAVSTGLDANAWKAVIQITAAGRARIFRGLEARAEVSALARDGRLELVPLLGAGAAF
jgi:hypothetical protein